MSEDLHGKQLEAIEPLEAWLGQVMRRCPEPECRSIEVAKHRVRLALGDQSAATEPPTEALDRIKHAVRCELQSSAAAATSARAGAAHRLVRFGLTGLAAAAVLAFAAAIWQLRGPATTVTSNQADFEDFVEVVAGAAAELDDELASLEMELNALAESLVMNDDMFDDSDFDELGEDLDDLLAEMEES